MAEEQIPVWAQALIREVTILMAIIYPLYIDAGATFTHFSPIL